MMSPHYHQPMLLCSVYMTLDINRRLKHRENTVHSLSALTGQTFPKINSSNGTSL